MTRTITTPSPIRFSRRRARIPASPESRKYLEEAQQQLADIENDSYLASLKSQHAALLDRYETLNKHRDGLIPSTVAPYRTALDDAEYELNSAQIYYNEAVARRDAAYQDFQRNVAINGVNLREIADNIRVQQEKIKSLAGDDENVITASVSGTIDTVDCTAGDTVTKDKVL